MNYSIDQADYLSQSHNEQSYRLYYLAAIRVYLPHTSPHETDWALTPLVSPLPIMLLAFLGGIVSVALSLGSPLVAVNN